MKKWKIQLTSFCSTTFLLAAFLASTPPASAGAKDPQEIKTKGGLTINYIPVPAITKLVEHELSLGKWQRSEAERIEKLKGTPGWEKETQKFRNALLKKKAALLKMERDFEAKRRQGVPEPLLRPLPPRDSFYNARTLTHWREEHLSPDEISVGYAYLDDGQIEFEPSDLIYPCPDNGMGERWSAWFKNNEVELFRKSTYIIEGAGFTGQMRISMQESAEGVADINTGGYVSLAVGTKVEVYRNTGTAEQPQWRLVILRNSGTPSPFIRTVATGTVSLKPAALSHSWEFTDVRPGDVVQTAQHVYVKAVDAEVQMGHNRNDCASGNVAGFIYTSMPTLELQYLNIIKPALKEIPVDNPWP